MMITTVLQWQGSNFMSLERARMTWIPRMQKPQIGGKSNYTLMIFIFRAISEEEDVVYSQSSDSDHEEEHEDEIDKKQTSFNQQKIAATSQVAAQTQPSGGLSPP